VLVTASDPNISGGGATRPCMQHAWFPDDDGVIGLATGSPGPQAIVMGVRYGCDGCHQNLLPHSEQTFVSFDRGHSYRNLSLSSPADPLEAGAIYGTATHSSH
jgi:hypothetical protein